MWASAVCPGDVGCSSNFEYTEMPLPIHMLVEEQQRSKHGGAGHSTCIRSEQQPAQQPVHSLHLHLTILVNVVVCEVNMCSGIHRWNRAHVDILTRGCGEGLCRRGNCLLTSGCAVVITHWAALRRARVANCATCSTEPKQHGTFAQHQHDLPTNKLIDTMCSLQNDRLDVCKSVQPGGPSGWHCERVHTSSTARRMRSKASLSKHSVIHWLLRSQQLLIMQR